MRFIYTDYDDMPLSKIIYGWEYFATIGVVGYGVLWIVGKVL